MIWTYLEPCPSPQERTQVMKIRPSLIETASVTGFFVLGFLLRTWALDREAVEHFDEGVYASVLWHDGAFQAP